MTELEELKQALKYVENDMRYEVSIYLDHCVLHTSSEGIKQEIIKELKAVIGKYSKTNND